MMPNSISGISTSKVARWVVAIHAAGGCSHRVATNPVATTANAGPTTLARAVRTAHTSAIHHRLATVVACATCITAWAHARALL